MENKRGYGKIARRWKRIISSMLVLAMVLSSVPTTGAVYAAGISSDDLVQIAETASTEAVDTSTEAEESSEADSTEAAGAVEPSSTEAASTEEVSSEADSSMAAAESSEAEFVEEEMVSTEESGNKATDNKETTDTTEVIFRYYDESGAAGTVCVNGEFNNWGAETFALTKEGNMFYGTKTLTADESYGYKFVIDGSWEDGDNRTLSPEVQPVVNGQEVTFTYKNADATSVYVAGSMNSWSTSQDKMTETSDGVFTYTMTLPMGIHQYKFVYDGNWTKDLYNPGICGTGANSIVIVPGLESYTGSGTKGEAITLPSTLGYVSADSITGEVKDTAVTYSVKTEGASEYVTIDGTSVTVSPSYTESTLELTAATADGGSSTVTLNLVDQMYNYTIYTYSHLADRMSTEESELHIWGTEENSTIVAADHAFTETEVIDGKTWLKAEVSLPSAEKIGLIFREKEANTDNSQWATADLFYENTDKAENTTLYIVDGQSTIVTDINDVEYTEERYIVIDYTRSDATYTGAHAYTWYGDWGTVDYNVKEINGAYLVQIPVLPSSSDKSVSFIMKTTPGWDAKDGGDNSATIPADQKVVKVRYSEGAITKVLPYNMGSSIDRTDNIITFYYRDDMKFANNTLSELKDKVQIVIKTSTEDSTIDGTYDMTYDSDNERFVCTDIPLKAETDYYYYYLVDGAKVLDAYNELTGTLDNTEYSLLRNVTYDLTLLASVKYESMDYNDNNLLSVSWEAEEGEDLDGFVVKEMYADLSELGLGSKTAIDPELNELTIGCREDIAAGDKNIKVTVVDNAANTYTTTTSVKVEERSKTANTDSKLGDFDWDEAVIYFAVTDRFYDGNESNNTATEGYDPSDETDQGRYHGGDLAGLTEKIDYLYDLGINTIWLTPIVDNVDLDVETTDPDVEYYGYHGYWAQDFTKLNPHLGTSEELTALIEAAHAKGMKIMVDVVLNHAGYDATGFNTVIKDKDGNNIDMIRGAEDTITNDQQKDSLSGLPDFLTENEDVRNQLIEWQTNWMTDYDIDYYRVDTVKHVDNTTWSAFKNALTEENPEFKMIGEYYGATYTSQYDQLDTGRMDSLLDFGFKEYAKSLAGGDITSAEANMSARNAALSNTATMGSFLSSHDENGLLYTFINDWGKDESWAEAIMKVSATFQITAKGQPVIYYGEEIGQTGSSVYPYYTNRYDFDWDELTTQQADAGSMYNHYKKMLNIRRDYSEVFAKGDRGVVTGSNSVGYEVIRRSYEGKSVYVGMNVWGNDAENVTFSVTGTPGSTYKDLYNGDTYTVAEDGTVTIKIPAATSGGTAVLALTDGTEEEIQDTNTITLKLHYSRTDGDYTDWSAWLWTANKAGAAYDFVEENGEMVATMEVEDARAVSAIKYIIRKGDWEKKDVDADQSIDVSDVLSGTVHFYVKSGVAGGTRVLGADAITGSKIINAVYDRDIKKVTVTASKRITGSAATAFTVKCVTDNAAIEITDAEANGSVYTLTLEKDLSTIKEAIKDYTITYAGYDYPLYVSNIYTSDDFEEDYTYEGDDLGATWTNASTTFKVWAPTADSVKVALYESGTAGTDDKINDYSMTPGEKGVWSVTVEGNLEGKYYTYLVTTNNEEVEACDPYARTTGVNGKRAMIIDLDSTDPEGWSEDKGPHEDMNYTDAILYELHVRDASIDENSGVSDANKGKFLGLTETGTTTSGGVSTALDHIKNLGVTHVHLLPVYDYGSVDETRLDEAQFNWGYDPVNYNVPEGSYSSDPYNGEVRVKEMKQMVKTMHDNGINVVMDVVYNHVYDADSFCFNQIVPKYFSRTNEDGSYTGATGCGNDTASERAMVRKYIVDSVLYWAKEYHIDGFRFDLVGILDVDTMNEVIEEVHKYDPDIIFYGEGWNMTSVEGETMATQGNASQVSGLAFFSDNFRDNLAGNNTNGKGFIFNYAEKEDSMAECFSAATSWCPSPTQTVNYACCHDNYTLKDKLNVAAASATEEERIKMNNLAAAMYMTAEGIPFIHAGEEFLRTKVDEDGTIIHNSYNSSDYVNKLRWGNLEDSTYADVADYYKGLIEFRKNHEALRLTTSEAVEENVSYTKLEDGLILFEIKGKANVSGEASDNIVMIFNANNSSKTVDLSGYGTDGTEWKVCINAENAGTDVLSTVSSGGSVTVDGISAMALVQGATVDTDSVYGSNVKETISLDKTVLNMKVGTTDTLTAKVSPADVTVTWSSTDEKVAVVDKDGKVTAVAAGQATITAQTSGGSTATCIVTVSEKIYNISETEITLDLTVNETKTLSVTDEESETVEVTWSSADETVASVDADGKVTPVSVDSTNVSASLDGKTIVSCKVIVTASLTSISVTPEISKLNVGESAQLTIVYNPENAVVSNVTWTSSDPAVVTVDQDGKITALTTGKAVITANADGKTAECTVKVSEEGSEETLQIPEGITAVTNIHKTLGDVSLPEGWSWLYDSIPVSSFAGVHTKNFQAVYEEENSEPVEAEIPVSIVTISKVNVNLTASVVEKDKSTPVTVDIITTGGKVPDEMVKVEWKSSKPTVASVVANEDSKYAADVNAVAKGSAKLTATVTIADGELSKAFTSAKKSIKVVDTPLAEISFKSITEFESTDKDGVYKLVYMETPEKAPVVTVASTSSKVTLKSSDAKVVKVGRVAKNENGEFVAELTVKKAGYVKLSAIADDAAKTATSIELYVKNAAPNVNTNTVELNNKSSNTASVFIYPNEDYEIESVSIDNADFAVTRVGETNEYAVSMTKVVDPGNYDQNLQIRVKGAEEDYTPSLKIKVTSKDPSVKVKQTAKVNLFYNDAEANGSLTISSTEKITNVTLSECGYEYDYTTNAVSLKKDGDSSDKSGILSISFEGYAEPVSKNITIATENKKPSFVLSAKSGVLYPDAGIETAKVTITDVTTGNVVTAEEIKDVTFKTGADAYDVAKADNTVTFTRKDTAFNSKASAQIVIRRANFTEDIPLSFAISVKNGAPSTVLDKKSVTLNMNSEVSTYETAVVNVSVKDAPTGVITAVDVKGANAKSVKELGTSIAADVVNNTIQFSLKDISKLKKGNYKFKITGKNGDYEYKTATVTVKVADTAPEKTVKFSKSGKIDILNRDTTSIIYKPKLTNITGNITNVALTGRSAHLFKAELVDGNIKVTVKGNSKEAQNAVNLITKYNYGIKFRLTLDNGTDVYKVVTTEQKIKLTQSKPKVTVVPKQAVMFNTVNNNEVSVVFNAQNKDGSAVAIDKVELTNFTNAFAYDKDTGLLSLTGRGEVVKGKTYSLKFNVYCDGCADSEKPLTVTYKVKVN